MVLWRVRLATLRAKHVALAPAFTERSRRLWAATEARALGHDGIGLVERATGISRATIQRGLRELKAETSHCYVPTAPKCADGRSKRSDRVQSLSKATEHTDL